MAYSVAQAKLALNCGLVKLTDSATPCGLELIARMHGELASSWIPWTASNAGVYDIVRV